jgi:hypothetical protein
MKNRSTFFNLLFIAIICIGLFQYYKIGNSLAPGTLTEGFINVSPFARHAGEKESLPAEVIAAKKLIGRNSLKIFSLADNFLTDPLLYQRIIEFAYPARVGGSSYFIGIVNGELKSTCHLIDSEENVGAYACK